MNGGDVGKLAAAAGTVLLIVLFVIPFMIGALTGNQDLVNSTTERQVDRMLARLPLMMLWAIFGGAIVAGIAWARSRG